MDDLSNQDSAKPAHGQQVISCVAFIHKIIDNKPHVMLAKRSETKKFLPGKLEFPGGHIDFGEQLVIGLKREIKEEMDIDIELGMPFSAFTYVNEVKGSHSVEIVYFARLAHPEKDILLNPADHSEIIWVSEDTINDVISINGPDDPELPILKEGLRLLNGGTINT